MTSPTSSSRSRSSSSPTSALPPPYTFTTFVYEPTSAIVPTSFGAGERHVSPTTPTSLISLPSPPPAPPEPFLPRGGPEPTVIGTTVPLLQPQSTQATSDTEMPLSEFADQSQPLPERASRRNSDPYTEAMTLVDGLMRLCERCMGSDDLLSCHLGELILGFVNLLGKARELGSLGLEEEQVSLEGLIRSVEVMSSLSEESAASTQREAVWKWVSELLPCIRRRLADEHATLGLQEARRALEVNRAALARQRVLRDGHHQSPQRHSPSRVRRGSSGPAMQMTPW